uniref:At1g61320/AtMIF1 LRR domain-containing protein n=1 Tax=Ananas comosus var. bracteatus TaxID=296719 RepID=A0A6V7QD53_ANACO|nr:unnamed protein product [Ananas comosus var. bracteatus]
MDSFTPSCKRSESSHACVGRFTRPYLFEIIRELRRHHRNAFIRFVSDFLRANRGLRRLSLHFDMKNKAQYRRIVDRWISRAAKAGVNELELVPWHWRRAYEFPWRLLANGRGSFFTRLKLGRCRLGRHYDFRRLSSISRLYLADVNISQEIVIDILRDCKSLESLTLESCSSNATISIAPPELQLRELVVYFCFEITSIELSAPKLRRLQYYGDSALLSFKSVPCLEHVWLSYCTSDVAKYTFESLLPELPRVSDLVLDFRRLEVVEFDEAKASFPFSGLKDLTVNVFTTYKDDLIWIAALLEAAPFLEKLQTFKKASEVRTGNEGGGILWQPTNGFQHRHLRDVRMHDFEGSDVEIAFARFLTERAVVLRSLVLTGDCIYPGKSFAPKLRRLQYSGFSAQFLFKSVPCLEHVSLRYASSNSAKYIFENLLCELAHVSDLVLDFTSHEHLMKPRLCSPFSNLKDLTVDVFTTRRDKLIWLAAVLEAAPFLEKLQTTVTTVGSIDHAGNGGGISWQRSNGFQHHHLMDVKMHHFEGSDFEIAFARFLLEKAVVLSVCHGRRWTEKEKSHLLEQLTAGIASSARIIFSVVEKVVPYVL